MINIKYFKIIYITNESLHKRFEQRYRSHEMLKYITKKKTLRTTIFYNNKTYIIHS